MQEDLLAMVGLSFDRMRNFCRVADAGSISRAAGGDPGRQSLYSRQIRELESFFNTELVRRQGRGLILTDAGLRLARLAREQFAAIGDFRRDCVSQPLEITISAGVSVVEWALLPLIPQLAKKLPQVRWTLLSQRTVEMVRELVDHKIDLAIVRHEALEPRLRSKPLLVMNYALYVPIAWCKGESDESVLERLPEIPIATSLGDTFRGFLEKWTKREKLTLNIKLTCASFTLAAQALSTGSFAAILPTIASSTVNGSKCRRIELPFGKDVQQHLSLAWDPRLAAVRPVIAEVVETVMKLKRG